MCGYLGRDFLCVSLGHKSTAWDQNCLSMSSSAPRINTTIDVPSVRQKMTEAPTALARHSTEGRNRAQLPRHSQLLGSLFRVLVSLMSYLLAISFGYVIIRRHELTPTNPEAIDFCQLPFHVSRTRLISRQAAEPR